MKIYLLTENGRDHGTWDVLSWSANRAQLESEAVRLEWEHYHQEVTRRGEGTHWRTLSPDETDYRRFGVAEVGQFTAEPTDPRQTPMSALKPIGFASVVDIELYATTLTIHPHLPGVYDVAMFTKDQLHSAVNAALQEETK